MRERPLVLSALLAVAGCGSSVGPLAMDKPGDAGAPTADADEPELPTEIVVTPEAPVHVDTVLVDGNPAMAAALLPERQVAIADSAGRIRVGPVGGELTWAASARGAVLALTGVRDRVLFSATDGLFAITGGAADRAELDALFRPGTVRGLLQRGPHLWLTLADGVFLYEVAAERLLEVALGDPWRTPSVAALRCGAPAEVWLSSGDTLLRFDVAERSLLSAFTFEEEIRSVAAAAPGRAWIVSDDRLIELTSDGDHTTFRFESPVREVCAPGCRGDVWVRTDERLWLFGLGSATPVELRADRLVCGDAEDALALHPGGVTALLGELKLGVSNWPEAPLSTIVAARVHAPAEQDITSLTATADGRALEIVASPSRVLLDPWRLGPGSHHVVITVRYADGTTLVEERDLTVDAAPVPTWAAHVRPIAERNCWVCHGPVGYAHKLDTAALWASEIDDILAAVREERMPRPPEAPLSIESIAVIEAWKAAGAQP